MYNCILPTLLIYPIKHLNPPLLSIDSLLESTSFSMSTLSILISYLYL